jgi:hypothetical protein
MNAKMQAARQAQQLRNLEADKAAAEAASKGVTTAKNAAQTSEAMEMANAARAANMANKVISPANKAVSAARQIQAGRVGSDMPNVGADTQPDYQSDEAGNLLNRYPAPVVDDRTARDPANYKPEEKKQIVAAAKEAIPHTEDNDGWSKNDWLQFGLSMMAGQSPNALTNIGAAGLGVIASKTEKAREQSKLDLYKSVHGEKPGQSIQIAERLMAADPKLTFEQALAKTTSLIGGSTKDDLADIRADAARTARIKVYQDGMKAIEGSMVGILGKSATATPAQKQAYQNAIASLGPNPALEGGQQATLTAPAASPIKVLGVRPNP